MLLTASCDLEPRRLSLPDFGRSLAAAGGPSPSIADHVPAIVVLTTAAAIDSAGGEGALAPALFGLQSGLRGRTAVALGGPGGPGTAVSALAIRGSALGLLAGGAHPEPETVLEAGASSASLPEPESRAAAAVIGAAVQSQARPLSPISHSRFLEQLHIDRMQTTFPLGGDGPHRARDTVAAAGEAA